MHVTQIDLEFVELPDLPDEDRGFVPNPALLVQPKYLLSMWDCSCKLAGWDAQKMVFRDQLGELNPLAIRAWATLPQPIEQHPSCSAETRCPVNMRSECAKREWVVAGGSSLSPTNAPRLKD